MRKMYFAAPFFSQLAVYLCPSFFINKFDEFLLQTIEQGTWQNGTAIPKNDEDIEKALTKGIFKMM